MSATATATREVRLDVDGMSCASCAARVEKALNDLDGVEATVNFATEQATLHCVDGIPVEALVGAVEGAGYGARLAVLPHERGADAHDHAHADESVAALRQRLALAIALTIPVALVAMVPALEFAHWEWIALALSTPVVFYAGAGFHRVALRHARHRAASMDTLISLGTLTAWTWSVVVLVGALHAWCWATACWPGARTGTAARCPVLAAAVRS